MLSQGPIPRFVHGLIEYAAGVLFIAAPIVFSFDSGPATAISIVIGVVVLVIAATTDGPTSLVNSLPLTAHVVLDYVLAVLLVAMPFVAGFSDETNPTVFFVALGVTHLLITTRDPLSPRVRARAPGRLNGREAAEGGLPRRPPPSSGRAGAIGRQKSVGAGRFGYKTALATEGRDET